jgi:hypothetical protein
MVSPRICGMNECMYFAKILMLMSYELAKHCISIVHAQVGMGECQASSNDS